MTMIKPSPNYPKVGSVEVGERKDGETAPRRNATTAERLVTQPLEGIETTVDIIKFAARVHGTKNALGWRDVVDIHEEEKVITKNIGGKEVKETKKWKYFQLGSYQYLNYIQVRDAVSEIGQGLVELGVGKDQIFNVYASTSVNWQLMAHACTTISTPIATAYDTLGESGLTHSLNEPECVGVFTNADLLTTVSRVLKDTPTVKLVVYDGQPKAELLDSIRKIRDDLKVYSIDEVRSIGKDKPLDDSRLPKPEDVACIMYTSGTTGAPKGVVITHSNLIASVGAVFEHIGHHFRTDDTFLAYLPLAHILEFIVELALFFIGMTIGYGRVKTLTDASVRNCLGDLREFKPSILVGVPAVWETIRKGIVGQVNSAGSVTKSVFKGALNVKKQGIPGLTQLVDAVILGKVKEKTGGRLRLALSGGAAISQETQEFLTLALVTVLQGYGMTESCGMCAILPPEYMQYGPVGIPLPSVEIKLLDHPEASYLSTNNPPQGEVLIRGPSVTKGYYKRDDLNNDPTIFTADGWLRTGDVGQWNADGSLTIIDRIKNLVKLESGEYIALERLETVYKACNLVSNVCVHAQPNAKQPMAVIIPNSQHLHQELKKAGLPNPDVDLAELCHRKDVVDIVLKACNADGKKNGFKPMELLQAVVLTPDEWTPESGLVTPAQKLQRKKIVTKFDKEIKEAYEASKRD